MAARTARQPNGRVTEVFTNAAQRQGAYALLENSAITVEQIAEQHFAATAARAVEEPFVFVSVDGSSLSLTDNTNQKGFGSVGTRAHGVRGLKVMTALAVSPRGVPLGLLSQVWWSRTGPRVRQGHGSLPVERKETQHWLTAITQASQKLRVGAPRTRCWFQLDREADSWPILMHADIDKNWFTIRGSHNRRVRLIDGKLAYLRPLLEAQGVTCSYKLPIVAGFGRKARTALLHVQTATVTLDLRDKPSGKRFPKELNAVLVREQSPPSGEKAIEWILLTNRPVHSTEDVALILYGYAQRWRIEDFHRTWKSGACNVERSQLRSVSATIKWATLLAAVATRIERIKVLSRSEPDLPADKEFSPLELRAIMLLRFDKKPPKGSDVPTLAKATQWLAEIGGYTGKSSGGPPGSIVLNRGFTQVQAVVRALEAMNR